jgi:GntR family transcriptional regulator
MAEGLSEGKSRRIYLVLRDRILSNVLARGARLPTENDLARFHRVSRVTVRRALAELERERLIERRRSSGTRVIYQPKSKPMTADISGVLANLTEMGERTASELREFHYLSAPAAVADALGLGSGAKVQRSVRIRSVRGMAFSYLTAHVPEDIGRTYSRSELAAHPLLALLERSGAKLDRASQRMSAVLASPDVARALKVRVGSPLIELVRVVFDRNGRGVEHLHALYRPDRYNFELELVRAGEVNARTWMPGAAVTVRRKRTKQSDANERRGTL